MVGQKTCVLHTLSAVFCLGKLSVKPCSDPNKSPRYMACQHTADVCQVQTEVSSPLFWTMRACPGQHMLPPPSFFGCSGLFGQENSPKWRRAAPAPGNVLFPRGHRSGPKLLECHPRTLLFARSMKSRDSLLYPSRHPWRMLVASL